MNKQRSKIEKSRLPLALTILLGAGVAVLLGLGRVRGDQENAAAPPASALGPVHAVRITVGEGHQRGQHSAVVRKSLC